MTSPAGIVAFDLDGTLVPNTTVCLHLAPWVGHHGMAELERLYAQGQITNAEGAERDATFYKNRRRHDVMRQLEQLEIDRWSDRHDHVAQEPFPGTGRRYCHDEHRCRLLV